MPYDILRELRKEQTILSVWHLKKDAADEIERLRAEVLRLEGELERQADNHVDDIREADERS